MRLINVETLQLEEFSGEEVPPYAILSHTWASDNRLEPSFRDVVDGGGRGPKLEGCCEQAKQDGLSYAWIDTCCINKDSSAELGEAINSMFQWYEAAAVCYVYLSDVGGGGESRRSQEVEDAFSASRWFRRGWTLQELLAPAQVVFYDRDWTLLGTRAELVDTVEVATRIPRPFLLGLVAPHEASVAQRMSWAAGRVTKRREDMAYCLLGIMGLVLPIIYGGDGSQAFDRLQEELMKSKGDDSILAWGLENPAGQVSCGPVGTTASAGVFAKSPSGFAKSGNIVTRERGATPVDTLPIISGRLRINLRLYKAKGNLSYGLLNCGPEHDASQVVGIPLVRISRGQHEEFIRPQGLSAVLLPKPTWRNPTAAVSIRIGRVSVATSQRQNWFYIEDFNETGLELIDVHPRARWRREQGIITTTTGIPAIGDPRQRTLVRFRSKHSDASSQDAVVVLDFDARGSQERARCSVLSTAQDTDLRDLAQTLTHKRRGVPGKKSASTGQADVRATVASEKVAGQSMFVVSVVTTPAVAKDTTDSTTKPRRASLGFLQSTFSMSRARVKKTAKAMVEGLRDWFGRWAGRNAAAASGIQGGWVRGQG